MQLKEVLDVMARQANTARMQGGREYPGNEDAPSSESDTARLLRAFAIRALALALIASLIGQTTLAILLALVGFGLLFAPVGRDPHHQQDASP